MCDVLLPTGYLGRFYEDNEAMIRVCLTGKNPTMRHLSRTHRISVAFLHEWFGNPETKQNVVLEYCKTDAMSADIYTKAFTDKSKWVAVCDLINILAMSRLSSVIVEFSKSCEKGKPVAGECACY